MSDVQPRPSRWEVHSAIQSVLQHETEEQFTEALKVIIRYGHTLKRTRLYEATYRSGGDRGDTVSGFAEGIGNVDLSTEGKKQKTHGLKREKDRVGHYRLYKCWDDRIVFHHFWASDDETSASEDDTDLPETYYVVYDPETLVAEEFGTRVREPVRWVAWLFGINFGIERDYSLWERE